MVRAWTESLRSAYPDWGRERWQRRLERKLRRRAEREAKIANVSVVRPEETVQALRATCRDLTRRERELRTFLSPEKDSMLAAEREALQKRIDLEADDVTKMRLASALAALDQQRNERSELV